MTLVAAPQWRISTDRAAAAKFAVAEGADELHLDFGGAHRGPLLSDAVQVREAVAIAKDIPIPVLAVNHLNDIGLTSPEAGALLEQALDCARALAVAVLHIPGFRRSLPTSAAVLAGTAQVLRGLCEQGLTVAYESPLGATESLALARAVDHPALCLVLDSGNLREAGEDPLEFAASVGEAGMLLPDLHIKDPGFDDLPDLLRTPGLRSVLVENDYHTAPARLRTDIALVGSWDDKDER
ncbi:epimerase [Kribbella antibiotica]|uniref:Epimerase n=1 Tax=Kribbella antibiotica TaxID=190195 RepID=A0A4R4YRY8_9ACTN|nr:TIM barrel protein [Kribbella antibiotica]TDD48045.1 epimerase [Kribbella antibiotica]